MAANPVVHWHTVSVTEQPELAIAVWKHGMAQSGIPVVSCASTTFTAAAAKKTRRVVVVNFIFDDDR